LPAPNRNPIDHSDNHENVCFEREMPVILSEPITQTQIVALNPIGKYTLLIVIVAIVVFPVTSDRSLFWISFFTHRFR
jgi:hypothetical protein